MSYILDALKRADAERERGLVPGLHSQSPSALTPTQTSAAPKWRGLALLTGAAGLLLVAAFAWWRFSAPPAEQTAHAVVPAPLTEPVATAPLAPATETVPTLPILAPEPVAAAAAPERTAALAPQRGGIAASAPTAATATATPSAPATDTASGTDKVRSFADLSPETRAQLPQVSVSGSTYSGNPTHRMLIANGKVLREGEEIAPGLRLETIGPRSAVLNHNGTRYSIGF